MNRAVWKYALDLYGGTVHDVAVPEGGIVRAVGVQDRTAVVWVEVDPTAPLVTRRFQAIGTGHLEVVPEHVYLGTANITDLGLVLHVYEVPTEGSPA